MIKHGATWDPPNLVQLKNYDLYKWFSASSERNFWVDKENEKIFVIHAGRARSRENGILKEHNLKSLLSHGEILNERSKNMKPTGAGGLKAKTKERLESYQLYQYKGKLCSSSY